MKKMIFLSLLAFTSIATQAQSPKKTRSIITEHIIGPVFTHDKNTTTIKWSNTESNGGHEDIGILKKVPTTDIQSAFSHTHQSIMENFQATGWKLTDEGENTVLHCYLLMPADIVTNLWLGGPESVILDTETGIIYQAKGTVPERCYNKVFGVKSKRGTVLDLQIIFPRLPDTAKKLAIYGVPNWYLRGKDHLDYVPREEAYVGAYDDVPQFHMARMVKESVDYDKDNLDSWAVYTDPHLIKPVKEETMAIWRTPDATYLAIATEQNWIREYYGRGGNTILLDKSGNKYKRKEVMGYPNDNIFWLEGYPGDHFAIVEVFEPLPLDVTTFSYIAPEGEPFSAWGADWKGKAITDLNVQQLRDNQHLFEYHPRVVVK